jgi:hypothetical protein
MGPEISQGDTIGRVSREQKVGDGKLMAAILGTLSGPLATFADVTTQLRRSA